MEYGVCYFDFWLCGWFGSFDVYVVYGFYGYRLYDILLEIKEFMDEN